MQQIEIPSLPPDRFADVLPRDRLERFLGSLSTGSELLAGRTLWHVNSTAQGGGVAEMLQSVLGYLSGAGITTRWVVIDGNDDFFELTKRVHNLLHGEPGDGGGLGQPERELYERTLNPDLDELLRLVSPCDVVVLHDPQTAGLAPALKAAGAGVVWSCHVGVDEPNDAARLAWRFLLPYVDHSDAHVFSRRAYAWEGVTEEKVAVIPPCIDVFSPKNQGLDPDTCAAVLNVSGVVPNGSRAEPRFRRQDGTPALVSRPAECIEEAPLPADAPIVLQVSRWDRLKDPVGVLRGFLEHVPARTGAHLVLAGPDADSVSDDPEGEEVLAELREEHARQPAASRARAHIVCLPMDDLEENGAVVNALQRRADVVVQKSLAEGFGLTVAEAMWKERPTLGSRVGGIQDQIVHAESGFLLDDPTDLASFGEGVGRLLADRPEADRMGLAARERVCEEYLAPRHLSRYLELVERIA